MSSPAFSGRPQTPAPGAPAPELRIARLRPHARRLAWSALVLIGVSGAVGFFTGNLPEPWTDLALWVAAGALVLVLVVWPYARWATRSYTITTRRVIVQSGIFSRERREITHARGYTIGERRGPLQRLWGTGTLSLSNGVEDPVRLADIASVRLVHEVLADQIEVNQILAHRGGQTGPTESL